MTREPARSMEECELTYREREAIDAEVAARQHRAYCDALRACGAEVVTLPRIDGLPDSVFVEDTAIVLDELAVLTRPGVESRRAEIENIEPEVARLRRKVVRIEAPATLEGGDVMRVGRSLFVGFSSRTNFEGFDALQKLVKPHGYRVYPVELYDCLHLKTGCTALNHHMILANPDMVDTGLFGCEILPVDEDEPFAANVLRVGNSLLVGEEFPRTARMLADRGFDVRKVNVSEFAKAEGALTCMSLIFKQRPQRRRVATPRETEETNSGHRTKPREWKLPKHTLTLGKRTLVMGVINLTPDSFSDGGRWFTRKRAWDHADRMSQDGVDIIDIGGESTRPGATNISEEEEMRRVQKYVDVMIKLIHSGPYSIDTTKASVAAVALSAGVQIVNDISGLRFDPALADVAARYDAGLILMHSRGTFETMHKQEPVADIIAEVARGWRESIAEAERRGVKREKIVLDPGIGFGKTQKQNVELIAKLPKLIQMFPDFPILVGTSRKSFIGHLLGGAPVNKRVHGTMASVTAAVLNGASIVRVHDVRAAIETVKIADAIKAGMLEA
ncbi:MAG TPA: dihydropteroate synthase [Pyrinomonadaceae bacterium]|nr:dihydropteroate synthase [Pyrinomonadaceae bacterium]